MRPRPTAEAAGVAAIGRIEGAEAGDDALSIARCGTWSVEFQAG